MNPISLPVSELKPALAGLGKIINRHSKLPVLGCIKVQRTAEGWTALTATDLDRFLTVRAEQPAEGEALTILAPYRELLDITRACGPGERILLEPKDPGTVCVRFSIGTQYGEQPLKAPASDEFPLTPAINADPIPISPALRQAIHQALECASEDETRFILQGAYLDVSQPKAQHVVATDGKVLFSANSWQLPLKKSVLIPAHRFLASSEFNRDGEWQLRVSPDAPLLQINSRRWRFITRVPEGKYPDWRVVLPNPKAAKTSISIPPQALRNVINILDRLPCHDPEHHTNGLEWKQGYLNVIGRAPSSPEWVKVPVAEATGQGPDVTVFFNRTFLNRALEFELGSIAIIDSRSPVRFSNGSRQMIVMPIGPDRARDNMKARMPAPSGNGHEVALGSLPPPPKPETMENRPVAAGRPANGTPLPAPRKPAGPSRPRPRPSTPPRIEDALEQVGSLREAFRSGLAAICGLTAQLRGIKTSQRAAEKEVEAVRSRVRSIQNLKF